MFSCYAHEMTILLLEFTSANASLNLRASLFLSHHMTLYLCAQPLQIGCMQPLVQCSLTCALFLSATLHNKSKQAVTVLTKSSFLPAVSY